ncbi:hypothetical protein FOMG_19209 [Fusarium oxysporum f. sp. melonis 26406]|uniref:Uncharacterized protein n=1 Tax=Fusarium oxysporum f. sp. melonis 26406 TaxID=1089452 RepID=W9Z632_FUSOX|nr:hypothetical protein FOMG_19209 [Fusarium oxysporum f. sp. melonis 26406]
MVSLKVVTEIKVPSLCMPNAHTWTDTVTSTTSSKETQWLFKEEPPLV